MSERGEPLVAVTDANGRSPGSRLRRVGTTRTVGFVVLGCIALTVLVEVAVFDPGVGNRRFHVALETADALVLIFLAAVLLGRFRSDGSRRNLVLAGGVVVLAVKNGFFAASAMFAPDVPGNDPIVWGTAAAGVLGAGLLAAAGLITDRRIDNSAWRAGAVVGLGSAVVLGVNLVAALMHEQLPYAFPAIPVDTVRVVELDVLSGHPGKIMIDVVTAACYAVAAYKFARLSDRYRDDFMGWMAIGSTIAAGAFVYYAMIPSRFTELIYGGEIFWVLAIIAFWYGAIGEITNLESALVRSAVRAERKRVARDLHDGVVQELAYIATQAGWLLSRVRETELEQPIRRIADAVNRALDESRGAIAALNRELDEPLHQAVAHAAADVADRVGVRLDLDLDPTTAVPAE